MSNDLAIYLAKQMLWNALLISSPVIGLALLTGLLVSVLQVVTQIQDSTLSAVPKILVAVLTLMFCGSWMLHTLTEFAINLFASIPESIG